MGEIIDDHTTMTVLHQMNTRFGAGDAITEMAALHRQFTLFAPENGMRHIFNLLNIAPATADERRRWFIFLDRTLRSYPSDVPGENGHDRVLRAYQENLQRESPLPVFTVCHPMDDPRVLVRTDRPNPIAPTEHLVISIPIKARTPERNQNASPEGAEAE